MEDNVQVTIDVDLELWEHLKKRFPEIDEETILTKVLEQYSNLMEIKGEEDDVLTELDEQKKLAESLRKKCKNFALRVKELEDVQADNEGEIQKLKKTNRKLSKGIPDLGEQQVKEKIVYREDTKTINELKEKRDALQKTLWEKNAELEQLDKTLTEMKQKVDEFEAEKGKLYGLLVKLDLDKDTSKYQFVFEPISRGEFNKLMRSKVEFCKYKKIFTPASVIKLWEQEGGEIDYIDLGDAVKELRSKTDAKLRDVSMPYAEFEALKNMEKQFAELSNKHELIQTNFTQLQAQNKELIKLQEDQKQEIAHLKEHPIVKEKVVYKENTKELEEIKSECERLRLKLFNYETGRMSVPTHGINVGNVYKTKILGVGKDGDGFTKVNNFIIFVPNTKKDQDINIKITRVLKKYAFAKVTDEAPTAVAAAVAENNEVKENTDKTEEKPNMNEVAEPGLGAGDKD